MALLWVEPSDGEKCNVVGGMSGVEDGARKRLRIRRTPTDSTADLEATRPRRWRLVRIEDGGFERHPVAHASSIQIGFANNAFGSYGVGHG
ncbi:MAG: hypothetical protein IPK13_00815 [Deltaproteobacteria bacterium]|nr:hypothetical protein [Deltaproteobacteria bacterium]